MQRCNEYVLWLHGDAAADQRAILASRYLRRALSGARLYCSYSTRQERALGQCGLEFRQNPSWLMV